MKTGAAYIRVSTEEQIEFSPQSQKKKILEYAAAHEIVLPEEYIFLDEGISGRCAEKRPAFMKMIGMAKTTPRPFDVILVWKFSRFARNRQDSILYKSMLRKQCGVDVISITEQLGGDPTGVLIEALLEAMDEYYSINLAQEVKRGMNEKFSQGGVVSKPPFGYVMGKEKFVVDEQAAPLVQMIFHDFLEGLSCRQIAMKLNNMGARTVKGNLFESRSVAYILQNPVYLGKQRRGIKEAAPIVMDGRHPPLIEQKIFEEARSRLIQGTHFFTGDTGERRADYMLQGLVRCSGCGGTLTRNGQSLQCQRYAKGKCPVSHSIRLEKLNRVVLRQLEEDLKGQTIKIQIEKNAGRTRDKALLVLLDKERKRMKRLEEAFEAGVDTLEEYQRKKKEVQQRRKRLEAEAEERKRDENWPVQCIQKTSDSLIKILSGEKISEREKNILLCAFVSKIIFDRRKGTIEIHYYS